MSNKRRNKLKLTMEKVADFFDVPTSALPWGMDLELRNDRDIYISGCTGIAEYSKHKVVFTGDDMTIIAEGEDFELFTFSDGRIRLSGKIEKIEIKRDHR